MRKVLALLLIICASSCEYFNAKKIASEDIYKEEIKAINWNTIDIYPAFETCDKEATKEELKHCFETTLSNTISQALQQETIIVNQDIDDTVLLEFLISEKGDIQLQNVSVSDVINEAIPEIETILINSLSNLPTLLPAIKRDQPVKTAFTLPIEIKVN